MENMKKFVTLMLAVGFVLYLSSSATYAFQGRDRTPAKGADRRVERRDDRLDRREERLERIEDHLARDPRLAARLQAMLPPGMTLRTAAAGFQNTPQLVGTIHASKNLGIPFEELKAKVTGPNAVSLPQAIKSFRPNMSDVNLRTEVDKAEKQAQGTITPATP
jgi:hypothetical protein